MAWDGGSFCRRGGGRVCVDRNDPGHGFFKLRSKAISVVWTHFGPSCCPPRANRPRWFGAYLVCRPNASPSPGDHTPSPAMNAQSPPRPLRQENASLIAAAEEREATLGRQAAALAEGETRRRALHAEVQDLRGVPTADGRIGPALRSWHSCRHRQLPNACVATP